MPRRLALVAGGALGAILLLGVLGQQVWRRSLAALQPSYRMTFDQITLLPDPPTWYVGGKTAFLEKVATQSNHPREFNALDVDLQGLSHAFSLNPIVDSVSRVERKSRNRLIVRIAYHEPVARTYREYTVEFLLSRKAIFLPLGEVDLDRAGPLVTLPTGRPRDFARPVEPKEGLSWNRQGAGNEIPTPDLGVAEACRLAGFFQDHRRREPSGPLSGHDLWIHPPQTLKKGERCVLVQVGADQMYRWYLIGDPARRAAVEERRWTSLLAWIKDHPPRKSSKTYEDLDFTEDAVVPRRLAQPASDVPNSS